MSSVQPTNNTSVLQVQCKVVFQYTMQHKWSLFLNSRVLSAYILKGGGVPKQTQHSYYTSQIHSKHPQNKYGTSYGIEVI